MGGLFSSNTKSENVRTTTRESIYSYDKGRITTQRNSSSVYPNVTSFNTRMYSDINRPWDPNLHNKTSRGSFNGGQLNLQKYDMKYFPFPSRAILYFPPSIYQILPIPKSERTYWVIKKKITNRNFIIDSIERIENQLLENSYSLKKKQKLEYYPHLEELELFHGTKWIYADSICKNNFNWRCCGKEVGHRFGKGVSFSCNAMYASNYSDKDNHEKVMFIAKVMIGETCPGSQYMELPLEGCDTSTKNNDNIVVVKYEDNEFYPAYRIKFHISSDYVPINRRNRAR